MNLEKDLFVSVGFRLEQDIKGGKRQEIICA
jgi:hypothetical protein